MRLAVSFLPLPLMLPGLSGANYIIIKAINQNTSLANTWPKDISTAFKGIIYHSIVIVLQSSSPLANHPTIPRHPRHGMVPANQPTVFDSWNRKKTPDIWVFMGLVGSYGCLRGKQHETTPLKNMKVSWDYYSNQGCFMLFPPKK